jgi:hypothetical protein
LENWAENLREPRLRFLNLGTDAIWGWITLSWKVWPLY